jgi:coenzyme F420-0:L-glutamate ligase/coenzyme F420-1:gamma-L-glutamate ligase
MNPAPGARLSAEPLAGLPEVEQGADLAHLIAAAADRPGLIGDGDIVAVAQKVVSKAEGRVRRISSVEPGERARDLGRRLGKDPRLVQVILDESSAVLRAERGVLVVRTHHGLVCANAGVDRSNIPGEDQACLLPFDPDASARTLRAGLFARLGVRPAVIVTDSFGRAWRMGQHDVAIGCAGLVPLADLRGQQDAQGRPLEATMEAVADAAAAAAGAVRRKAGRDGVVIVRGLDRYVTAEDGPGAAELIRPIAEDLFP